MSAIEHNRPSPVDATNTTSSTSKIPVDPFLGTTRFVFESDLVPPADRIDFARELSAHLFNGFHLLPPGDPDFRSAMWASRAGDVTFGSGFVTSSTFRLGPVPGNFTYRLQRREEEEGVFWIYLKGSAAVRQGAVEGVREAGTAWFMSADVPGEGLTDGTHVVGINVPSKALRRALGHNKPLEPTTFGKGNPLVQLLAGYVESTQTLPCDADPALLSSVGAHLTDLVALAMRPTKDAAEQAISRGLKSARVDAIVRLIGERFADPDFSVPDVAARLKVSVRYVQDLLHETGIGFSERVLELRLQEAGRLLAARHQSNRKVSDIAFSCGFNNLSYFHRAFRRRFGMTPAGLRQS